MFPLLSSRLSIFTAGWLTGDVSWIRSPLGKGCGAPFSISVGGEESLDESEVKCS